MKEYLLVGTGSFVGGVSRYFLSGLALHMFASQRFPIGTLVVNFLGCLAIGILSGLAEHHHLFTQNLRILLITGLLGGFTTFSAFGYETIYLVRTNNLNLAILNVVLSLVLCLTAVWLGTKIIQMT